MQNNIEFILIKKQDELNGVVSLYFKTVIGLKYEFKSGQYVDIKPESITGHGKSYTISSAPSEDLVRITIKRKGAVSSAIIDLNIGEKIFFEGPYGVFYPEETMKSVVMLAGGIGITPFFSVIKDKIESSDKTNFTLLYSNKTKSDIVFNDDLSQMEKDNANLKIVHCITQESVVDGLCEKSRINQEIVNKYAPASDDRHYYICGSISFVSDMWRLVKSVGVPEDNIYTESFY